MPNPTKIDAGSYETVTRLSELKETAIQNTCVGHQKEFIIQSRVFLIFFRSVDPLDTNIYELICTCLSCSSSFNKNYVEPKCAINCSAAFPFS